MSRLPILCLAVMAFVAVPSFTSARQPAATDNTILWAGRNEERTLKVVADKPPVIEFYLQDGMPHEILGTSVTTDYHQLGELRSQPRLTFVRFGPDRNATSGRTILKRARDAQELADTLAELVAPDWSILSPQRYTFEPVGHARLGQAECTIFRVTPIGGAKEAKEGFTGDIYIDQTYHLVRYIGSIRHASRKLARLLGRSSDFRVDGWRLPLQPNQFVPAVVYLEEEPTGNTPAKNAARSRLKGLIRVWGYDMKRTLARQPTADIIVDQSVRDASDDERSLSPIETQRKFEEMAAANVIDRLSIAGMLSRRGEVDAVVEGVMRNLLTASGITPDPKYQVRLLLTMPMEVFHVGTHVILSVGLVDALPDEESLALLLAHQLSHILLGHPLIDTKYAFVDRLMLSDGELLSTLSFRHTEAEEIEADKRAMELLERSPYRAKLTNAGLFLHTLSTHATRMPALISARLGEHLADRESVMRLSAAMITTPYPKPETLDQIEALPLGARVNIDPSGRAWLLRTRPEMVSAREKAVLQITAVHPRIRYIETAPAVAAAETSSK